MAASCEGRTSQVMPDSTTEPKKSRRNSKMFQEGDDVFFKTNDEQNVLGTVGQIIGQTCQILFGDGTEQWTTFKRIKKLSAGLDDDEDDNASTAHNKTKETDKQPSTSYTNKSQSKQTKSSTTHKEETVEMFCSVCGIKKKITISKARNYKPEGPYVFMCKKCTKESNGRSSSSKSINYSSSSSASNTPKKSVNSVLTSKMVASKVASLSIQSTKGINIPLPDGKLSVFRKTPTSNNETLPPSNSSRIVKSFGSSQSPSPILSVPIPVIRKLTACFCCENEVTQDDSIPCNFCKRPCHLICLPLSYPPPKGDKFWDLMCISCGTQNNDASSRSRVFSVRRNIASWADVAFLILSCKRVDEPLKAAFELDSEILQYLEQNLNNMHLPRQYKMATELDRKKFILHALYNTQNRFVNGKEIKKRSCYWGLRRDHDKNKRNEQPSLKPIICHSPSEQTFKSNNNTVTIPNQSQALTIRVIPPPQQQKTNNNTTREESPKKNYTVFSSPQPKEGAPPVSCDNFRFVTTLNSNQQQAEKNNQYLSLNRSFNVSKELTISPGYGFSTSASSSSSSTINSSNNASPQQIVTGQTTKQALKRPLTVISLSSDKHSNDSNELESPRLKQSAPKKPKLCLLPSPVKSQTTPLPFSLEPSPVKKTTVVTTSPSSSSNKFPICNIPKSNNNSNNTNIEPQQNKVIKPIFLDKFKARAIKSSAIVPTPASALDVQALLKESLVGTNRSNLSPEKNGKPNSNNKPKLKKSPLKSKLLKSPTVTLAKLRIRSQGRTLRAKKQQQQQPVVLKKKLDDLKIKNGTQHATVGRPKLAPLKLTRTANGIQVSSSKTNNSNNGNVLQNSSKKTVDKLFSSVYNNNNYKPPEEFEEETRKKNYLNITSTSIMDAVLYGHYHVQCLPTSPKNEKDLRTEALKVYGHFRTEKQNETASLLLGRSSETETRSQTRRKSELFGRRQNKRDLNDFESYDVVAKRVDENGITQYYIVWKGQGGDEQQQSEIDNNSDMEEQPTNPELDNDDDQDFSTNPTTSTTPIFKEEVVKQDVLLQKIVEVEEEEGVDVFRDIRKANDNILTDLIDLTADSP